MDRKTKIIIGAGGLAAVAVLGAGVAVAGDDDDATERPIAAGARARAEAVALEHTGGGVVTGTEEGDEESFYEVEVTLDDGSEVDVQLDQNFEVVTSEAEAESGPDDD